MKIIVLTPNYPRKGAPINGYFIHQQVKALCLLGVECHVLLTYNWFPPLGLSALHPYWKAGAALKEQFFHEHEGVKVHHVPVKKKMPSRLFNEDPFLREAGAIAHYIKTSHQLSNADWIYANFLCDYGYLGTLVKEKVGIKLAAIARGDDVHAWPLADPRLATNLRTAIRKADVLLAVSRQLAHDTERWSESGFSRHVVTLYNGIDDELYFPAPDNMHRTSMRKELGLPESGYLILCVGAPIAAKGWLDLLDAIQMLGESFAQWTLVGVMPSRNYFNQLNLTEEAAQRGLAGSFKLLGQLPPLQMAKCYRAMDAFVLPSHNEGLSNSVMEAMASGLATVVTDVGGHREILKSEESGMLVPPSDKAQLTAALEKIITDHRYRHRLASRARNAALGVGSYKKNARELIELLRNTP